MYRRQLSYVIPSYKENAVLQLVVATAVGFILYNFTRVTFIVYGKTWAESFDMTVPYIGLPNVKDFGHKWWTILTYGWAHTGFFAWLSNAIWLYTFGNVVQGLVGHRQVIPVFLYGLIMGGIVCLLTQLIPWEGLKVAAPIMTAQAGVVALMVCALTISPDYRFYFGENFSIRLLVIAGIFAALTLFSYAQHPPMIMISIGGALSGYITGVLIKQGYRLGDWMYRLGDGMGNMATPNEDKLRRSKSVRRTEAMKVAGSTISKQQRIDAILDKINQYGYGALTKEERDLLQREGSSGAN